MKNKLALLLLVAGTSIGVCHSDPTSVGMAAYQHGDYSLALAELRPFAERGHGPSCVIVGRMYLDGQGLAADAKTAARYFRLGANASDALAATYLADLYASGNGVPRDTAEAAILWRKAGHLREPLAAHNLGILYWRGDGVSKNKEIALLWLEAAVAHLTSSQDSHREDFLNDRNRLFGEMTEDEISGAAQLVTLDGPTDQAVFRNGPSAFDDLYPLDSRRMGDQGSVVILILVGPDGRARDAKLETPSGIRELDVATLNRVRRTTVVPKMVNGQSVLSWQCVKVMFRLRSDRKFS